jgi:hypothetical protein
MKQFASLLDDHEAIAILEGGGEPGVDMCDPVAAVNDRHSFFEPGQFL